jgi:hypothetical protein
MSAYDLNGLLGLLGGNKQSESALIGDHEWV